MYASFIDVEDLADAVIELAYSDFKGILNITLLPNWIYVFFIIVIANERLFI